MEDPAFRGIGFLSCLGRGEEREERSSGSLDNKFEEGHRVGLRTGGVTENQSE